MKKLLELYEARLRNICGKLGGIVRAESKKEQQYFYDLCVRKECFQLIIEDIKEMATPQEVDMSIPTPEVITWDFLMAAVEKIESLGFADWLEGEE